jgi:galactokinase
MTIDSLRAALEDRMKIPPEWRGMRSAIPPLLDLFQSRYPGPHGREISMGFVPGRIEVLGRHTDYAGGRTLVCAVDRGFLCVSTPNQQGLLRMTEDSAEFPAVEFPLEPTITPRIGHWSNYPMTMARRLVRNFSPSVRLSGVDVAFTSTLPIGSGMSGSSALMMMTFLAIATVNRLHDAAFFRENIRDGIDLSMYLACAENGQNFRDLPGDRGVGTFGGSEDHAAIMNGREGRLSLFRFRPSVLEEELRWPRGWRMVVAFSGVRAEKTREALGEYNLVSRRAALAVKEYNRLFSGRCHTLREVAVHAKGHLGLHWLKQVEEKFTLGSRSARELALAGRIRQFVLEDRRFIPAAIQALRDRDLEAFGRQLIASHRASRRYLMNIAPEIDFLQRSAMQLGASGASGFGAGFGGSIVAVLPAAKAEAFRRAWARAYASRYPERAGDASFFLASPGPGIRSWDADGPARFVEKIFQA